MILSDRESKAALAQRRISITPAPPGSGPRWGPNSLDLTLDAEIRPWHDPQVAGAEVIINPASPDFSANALIEQHTHPVDCTNGYVLEARQFVLGWTQERIRLPHASRMGARVEGKSSLARIGLGIHVTAPTIHPGFGVSDDPEYPGSSIRLEIWNAGPLRIRLTKGMAICQILFEEVHGTPELGYQGQFSIQGPG